MEGCSVTYQVSVQVLLKFLCKFLCKFLSREVKSRWKLPDKVSPDNEREFVDKIDKMDKIYEIDQIDVKLIVNKLGIKQCFRIVYHLQSQEDDSVNYLHMC